ncbi:MAG: tetratricopeptide repeat protein [Anaerolineae bacterium]|jgi:thioredoxin-like negative regulator of GroEL|nr:tetratricopeptide repeat protein [Anaerolineae bacterium]
MPTIEDGQQAVEQGNLQQARLIFEAILQETPRSEDAWLGLAEVLTDTDDKRICYENVLKINKNNREAREALRNLEPQANPLIEALQPKAAAGEEEEVPGPDDTIVSTSPEETIAMEGAAMDEAQAGDGPPTFALVAVGLLLSVVFFAAGSGLVFFFISAAR